MPALLAAISAIAARQHGRISHAQLLAAGVGRSRIKRWCADGRLCRVHKGIYALGHVAPSLHADLMAAVLAGGPGAVVSHHSAAHALGILPERPPRPEISVPSTAGRDRPRVTVHRVRRLPATDTTTLLHIPITTAPRALLDLATRLATRALTCAAHEAWVRHRVTPHDIEACIARNPTKKGVVRLRRALGSDVTLSDLGDGFLHLLDRHRLPRPRTNIDLHGDKVDCHWPHLGLTVELHSYRFHASRWAFEQDHARRRRSDHLAYTWGDVFEQAEHTAAELRALLAGHRS